MVSAYPDIGAIPATDGVCFRVWAPKVTSVEVELVDKDTPRIPLQRDGEYYQGVVRAASGDRYWYWLDKTLRRPDPASRCQPEGVHGPSQVIDPAFEWNDCEWQGKSLDEYIVYELHVGAFTPEGTFDAAIQRLDYLNELGITAVELMPVAQFPGERNWGYDGVYPFAPQNSYGGPNGLKRLIDACHCRGLAVILDTVYNHLGPEGNYSGCFGHYGTERYRTPWGDAVNFDGPHSDHVRRFVIANALYWIDDYHVDALRLDAVHGIFDFSARHILEELATTARRHSRRFGRRVHVIAESDLNDVRLLRPLCAGGYSLDAQWSDDFHHSLHTLLTGETDGYYRDFGQVSHLAKALKEGFVYDGRYSQYRMRRHGSSSRERPARQFVVCAQNHDQIGNRAQGERLSALVSFESLKLAAGALLLSPCIPLLFMGEEYGESAPFHYFIDHSDPALTEAVRTGRKKEFGASARQGEPPDPSAVGTFTRSRLNWEQRGQGRHRLLLDLYRALIALRKESPALAALDKKSLAVRAFEGQGLLFMERRRDGKHVLCLFNFAAHEALFPFPGAGEGWRKVLDSADACWGGPGGMLPGQSAAGNGVAMNGRGFAVYHREQCS